MLSPPHAPITTHAHWKLNSSWSAKPLSRTAGRCGRGRDDAPLTRSQGAQAHAVARAGQCVPRRATRLRTRVARIWLASQPQCSSACAGIGSWVARLRWRSSQGIAPCEDCTPTRSVPGAPCGNAVHPPLRTPPCSSRTASGSTFSHRLAWNRREPLRPRSRRHRSEYLFAPEAEHQAVLVLLSNNAWVTRFVANHPAMVWP